MTTATIIQFVPRSLTTDGARARIQARRQAIGLASFNFDAIQKRTDDLTMDHVDTGIPCDVSYSAPERDPA